MNESTISNKYRVWKAKIRYDFKFFKRKDLATWEEYRNFELNNSFKFVKFDNNDDMIIQRISAKNQQYLRITNREIFIGNHKDDIYEPLFKGYWKEEIFLQLVKPIATSNHKKIVPLTINQIKEYMKLVRIYIFKNKIQINGLEDPDILEKDVSDQKTKCSKFFRVVNLNKNHWICCTDFLPNNSEPSNDFFIFDYQLQIHEKLLNLMSKWLLKEQVSTFIITRNSQDENLSDYYSLAFLTEYVMNNEKICVSYFNKLKFDETKFMTHLFDCIIDQKINTFPYLKE